MPSRNSNHTQETRARLDRLAWLLDSAVRLPGGFRIGLDGIMGLVPGVGDLAGAALSGYIVLQAARMKLPVTLLARMGLNVLLEVLIGSIPILGDLFDFAFKANRRNVRLMEDYFERTGREG
ncbi:MULTISPECIES: DUF4112 domain-containing protein [Oceanimonas]|uniref:DUF4112 domain-containing protein n=1 Tax=Oceanimonas doudoroffii TaxID=84158 RepID=A0A233RFI7_9GAMM|nr:MULTISPECIES: DUF4112 domain-containing protein [Oceanimonas]NHI01657.1 hypothetical protein [Oceanimonas sp. MB9]OXY82158.1 hypothetical protein B6S08_01055 [Oceanimonas doudoroffii]